MLAVASSWRSALSYQSGATPRLFAVTVGSQGTVGGRRRQYEQRVGTRSMPRKRCSSCSPALKTKSWPHKRHAMV
jgi:hypothetical protein